MSDSFKKKALINAIHEKLNSLLGRQVLLLHIQKGKVTIHRLGKLCIVYREGRPKMYVLGGGLDLRCDSFYAIQLISIVEVRDHVIITIKAYHP